MFSQWNDFALLTNWSPSFAHSLWLEDFSFHTLGSNGQCISTHIMKSYLKVKISVNRVFWHTFKSFLLTLSLNNAQKIFFPFNFPWYVFLTQYLKYENNAVVFVVKCKNLDYRFVFFWKITPHPCPLHWSSKFFQHRSIKIVQSEQKKNNIYLC